MTRLIFPAQMIGPFLTERRGCGGSGEYCSGRSGDGVKLIEAFVPLETDQVTSDLRRNLTNTESAPERQLFKLVPAS